MTLTGGGLFTFLTAPALPTLGDRVYPRRMPRDPTFPLAIYRRVSTAREVSHSGPTGLAVPRIQIDVWATDHDQADAAAEELVARIHGYRGAMGDVPVGSAIVVADADDDHPDTGLVRRVIDVEITHGELA